MPVDETAIRQWADRHECRRKLPILLRRLIQETTPNLSSLRFPGNEAVDLRGLDGQAETNYETRWVPQGRSVWEMGCNQEPRAKVDSDYEKRTAETSQGERQNTSFVFVTPRRWNGKDEWLRKRREEHAWSSVYAYDAIDLETWLESAPVTSRWLGELFGIGSPGLLTPQEWWHRWSTASVPPISMHMVATRRHNEADTLLRKLRDGEHVVSIQADDRSEAVAFVVTALIEADAHDLLDRTLVATSGATRIPSSVSRLILIADVSEGQELDYGDRRNITIVRAYPRGRSDVCESLQLSHVPSEVFRSELEKMGLHEDEAESLALETGYSVPVLRRRRSPDPEVRRPAWAGSRVTVKRLLPFALAGAWVERENLDDDTLLQLLGELEDCEIERIRDDLLTFNDAPVAKYGNTNVVVSQLDAIFAVGPYIERADLERFFQLVPEVLGDRDPALDLPQDQWWMASVLGKGRNYSEALLSGLGNGLCILAIYGAKICGDRLQINLAYRAGQVVRTLMQNATEESWLTIRGHLRALAEASPNMFLDCLEDELRRPEPAIRAIMGTTGESISGECLRTNLLWALELLAWHRAHFCRVVRIVFDLQRFKIDDNWTNSPVSTARSLFRVWLPATSLDVAERMRALRHLSEQFRAPTIDVCISLLPDSGPVFASKTATPQWRAIEQEVSTPTHHEVREAANEASRLLLDLAPFDKAELKKLLEIETHVYPDDLNRLVEEVERWAANSNDEEKAELRHDLRRRDVLYAYQDNKNEKYLPVALRRMEAALEPETTTARHRWLFDNSHVEWRAIVEEEIEGRLSWQEREARVQQKRAEAIKEIQSQLGKTQILPFALSVKQPHLVAELLVPPDAHPDVAAYWVEQILRHEPNEAANAFIRQVLWSSGWNNNLKAVVSILQENGALNDTAVRRRFSEHLPGLCMGWQAAEALGYDIAVIYWETVSVNFLNETPLEEVKYAIDRLLDAQRPRSAFFAVKHFPERLSPEKWEHILQAISYGEEPDGIFPDVYHLDKVFEYLDSASITDDRVATLELPFVPLLCRYGHRNHERTLALHRELARDPAFFVQLLCWHYRRTDREEDPQHEKMSSDRRQLLAKLACHTLDDWRKVPGVNEEGEIVPEQFLSWGEAALQQATEVDRKEVAEIHLGALLARFARHRSWDDWLPAVILEFMDRPENGGLRERFDLGVMNARGGTTRGPYDGGEQERRLASQYRSLAVKYVISYPRVSATLISIAESYERDARCEDGRAAIVERWHR